MMSLRRFINIYYKMRQSIKQNLEKILNGKMKISFVPAFRTALKESNALGEYKCKCGVKEWNNKEITLDLDHIDGNKSNNIKSNLRWLCPNCHSQTSTYRVKNYVKKSTRKWVDEIKIVESIKQGGTIAEILRRSGLRAVGDNYNRIHRISTKHNLKLDYK